MTIARLTIGSSDSSGGAGIQRDIKAFARRGLLRSSGLPPTTGLLAQGVPLADAVARAGRLASKGVRDGLAHLGAGVQPVDVLDLPAHRP